MKQPEFDTEIVNINLNAPEPEIIDRAAEVLRSSGVVAFPTETVYGLGANALNPDAIARIYEAKGRPSRNPLIVHISDAAAARRFVTAWPEAAEKLAATFWPGPLTLVLPRSEAIPDRVTGGGPTVAIRVPAHPVALALLRAAGFPVAAPSANRSNEISPTRAARVLQSLGGRIPLILDGGPTSGGIESTVLALAENPPRLLRPGLVSPDAIEAVIGPIVRGAAVLPGGAALPAPGMMTKHYAPKAPLILAVSDGAKEAADALGQGLRVGWLAFDPVPQAENLLAVAMPTNALEYAARLYAELYALDDANVERIVVARPPSGDDWLAVRDRLGRAADFEL